MAAALRQAASSPAALAPLPRRRHRFVVIAHRGDHTSAPENSLQALKNAVAAGADYAETDLRTTRDGHIVIMHDSRVDRTTNGTGPVAQLTLHEFRELRLKDPSTPQSQWQPPPTFEELLQAAAGQIHLYLDCKAVDPQQVTDLLAKHRMLKSCVVYADPDACLMWKKTAPRIPVMTSFPRSVTTAETLREWLERFPVEILDGGWPAYNSTLIEEAHRRKRAVWPDIQNPDEGPDQWQPAVAMGVDGLQTDHPEAMVQWLKKTGRR